MFRYITLAFTVAALSSCASTTADKSNAAKVSPNATKVEVLPPEPVTAGTKIADKLAGKNTDVLGNQLINDAQADALEIKAAEVINAPAATPELENLYYVAQTKWEMIKFIEAVNTAELATALEADGAMTVFAPTTEAFERAGNTAVTAELLKGHMVAGKFTAEELVARAAAGNTTLPTLAGTDMTIYVIGDAVKVADSSGRLYTVVNADNKASNGVLHQINGVLAAE